MSLPKWTRSKWVRWISAVIAIFVIHSGVHIASNQFRGRSIVSKAGLPALPSGAWVVHAEIYDHGLLFEEVSMGFMAPKPQMDEWLRSMSDWKEGRCISDAGVLNHTLREWNVISGVDFSASLSYK